MADISLPQDAVMSSSETKGASSRCDICAIIMASFNDPFTTSFTDSSTRELGVISDLLESECAHVEVIKWACERFESHFLDCYKETLHAERGKNSTSVTLKVNGSRGRSVFAIATQPLGLVAGECQGSSGTPGRACVLNEQWVDVPYIRSWIRRCSEEHGAQCEVHTIPHLEMMQPRYLIDIDQGCIVLAETAMAKAANETDDNLLQGYVTLSYTWGQVKNLQTRRDNFSELQTPGALFSGRFAGEIPNTIRDATGITKSLGYKFLWVDSLCIVQDDPEALAAEIGKMHLIYANSALCLVAERGADANFGLPGFEGISSSTRQIEQKVMTLAEGVKVMVLDPSDDRDPVPHKQEGVVYHHRMWTFQEYLFAKRRLVFGKGLVRWKCNATCWREDLMSHPEADALHVMLPDDAGRWIASPVPRLDHLDHLIQDFNNRQVSFPSDVPRAFAGMKSLLHRYFPGGLLQGLPEFWFDIALFWGDGGDRKRRLSSDGRPVPGIPSWSWMGWESKQFEFPADGEFSTRALPIFGFVAPVTRWYATDSLTSQNKRKIHSLWHVYRAMGGSTIDLPPGWTSKPIRVPLYSPVSYSKTLPREEYKHVSADPDESHHTWYPLPVLPPEDNPPEPKPEALYVTCSTTRAYFNASSEVLNSWPQTLPVQVLKDGDGNLVGGLLLRGIRTTAGVPNLCCPVEEGQDSVRVELVAIAKGWVDLFRSYQMTDDGMKPIEVDTDRHWHSGEDKSNLEGLDKEEIDRWRTTHRDRKDDCYFALWVEWKDGIAYRRGTAVVVAQRWEEVAEREPVELILG